MVCAVRRRQRTAGRKALAWAVDRATPLGLQPILAGAKELGIALDRRRRPAAVLESGGTLTKREVEVLALIAEGRTNREIALSLRFGEKTVATHVSNVLRKLGVHHRTEAAIAAVQLGIGPVQRPLKAARPQRDPVL
jgi:DNA-binding NarL/FixJ family response regulator